MYLKNLLPYFNLLRCSSWSKNFFIFAPLIFSGNIFNYFLFTQASKAFLLFCIASSFIYVLNDLVDIKSDKQHPLKSKLKPLASGQIKLKSAYVILFLTALCFPLFFLGGNKFAIVSLCYIALNIFYCFILKNIAVLDIFSVALSFILRVIAGSFVINLPLSPWMLVTTLSLALYLVTIKRRSELKSNQSVSRSVLSQYSAPLLDKYSEASAISAITFYSFYIFSTKYELAFTIPFVIFGFFRYWFLADFKNRGEIPQDLILDDKILLVTILVWVCSLILFLN